jgi:hypothetical protein
MARRICQVCRGSQKLSVHSYFTIGALAAALSDFLTLSAEDSVVAKALRRVQVRPAYFELGRVIDINKLQDRARKAESLSESQQLPTNKRRRVNGAVITKPPVTVSEKDAPEVVTVSDTHAIAGQNVRTPYGKGAVVGSSPTGCKVWWQVSV